MLTKEQILSRPRITQVVPVPEWGGEVRLQVMGGKDLMDYEAGANDDATVLDRCSRILAFTLVDEAGQLLFTEADIAALYEKEGKVVTRLGHLATQLNRLRLQDLEDAEKKSEPSPSEGFSSTSAWSWGSRIPTIWRNFWILVRSRSGSRTSAFFTRPNRSPRPHSVPG
jgi:hypothetical protein